MFLEYQGWLDTSVLDRQPEWWVYQCYELYKLRAEWGQLRSMGW